MPKTQYFSNKHRTEFLLKKPWLFLPAKFLYSLNPFFLKAYSRLYGGGTDTWNSFEWQGLKFLNPLGTAGGVDKNAEHIKQYSALGAGFLELGTVTPESQSPNPGKILDKSLSYQSLWNNMGSPNKGLKYFKKQLDSVGDCKIPLFINLGKNRGTSTKSAILDYQKAMESLWPYAGAFVINISSPNTDSLRDLFGKEHLPDFLKALVLARSHLNKNIPLILKLSPDETDFIRIIEQSLSAGIDGWCVCNSTKKRPVAKLFPKDRGGVSGRLLADSSVNLLKTLVPFLKQNQVKDKLIISTGGVLSPQEVFERLHLGANLVQVYSALVFKGYGFFRAVSQSAKQS